MLEGFELSKHKIGNLPDVHYVSEYISREEEQNLLSNIDAIKTSWTQVLALFQAPTKLPPLNWNNVPLLSLLTN